MSRHVVEALAWEPMTFDFTDVKSGATWLDVPCLKYINEIWQLWWRFSENVGIFMGLFISFLELDSPSCHLKRTARPFSKMCQRKRPSYNFGTVNDDWIKFFLGELYFKLHKK